MDVTSQDILNLTAAFEKLQVNRHIRSGYELNTKYRDLVLRALEITTDRYLEQFSEKKKEEADGEVQ